MLDTPATGSPPAPHAIPPVTTPAGAFIQGFREWLAAAFGEPKPDHFTYACVGLQMTETVPVARGSLAQHFGPPPVAQVAWSVAYLKNGGSPAAGRLVGPAFRYSIGLAGPAGPPQPSFSGLQPHHASVSLDPADGTLQIDNGPKVSLQLVDDVLVGSFPAASPSQFRPAGTVVTLSLYRVPPQPE